MFEISRDGDSITFNFSSEMEMVDRVIQSCRGYLGQFSIPEFSKFRLVLRELLINAVEHGNWNDADRVVTCSIYHMGKWQFRIMVEDEGIGFDPDEVNMNLPEDPYQLRNRGYPLINAFADRLEFNETGNQITVYLSTLQTTSFSVDHENGWQIITPSGDITASTADNFREILVRLLDRGNRQYRFDFRNVEDIDSVALSVMIIFSKMLTKESGKSRLEIVNARNALTNLFHLTRMDRTYKLKTDG